MPAPGTTEARSTGAVTASAATRSLPKGGGALRGIGEKFTANAVTGTGSFTVPIAVSLARGGAAPHLNLNYDSGAGNGPFGFGWSLQLPAITRRTDRGLPRYGSDTDPEPDVFILAGADDLVPVYRQDPDGSWVAQHPGHRREPDGGWVRDAAGALVIHDDDRDGHRVRRYRPRVEGLFARIERWTNSVTGATHWRSISRDNVTSIYGRDQNSQVFDPADADPAAPRRVFAWLVSECYDDRGNAYSYRYRAENTDGIDRAAAHERHRLDGEGPQRYLQRIRYGNRTPRSAQEDLSARTDWMFEIVFDYGDHTGEQPTPEPTRTWPERRDSFTTCRPGFEVRTRRLCRRVLLFHHFPDAAAAGPNEPAIGRDCLVRATEFAYDETPVASYLTSVTQASYRRSGAGYTRATLPAVEFTYTHAELRPELKTVDSTEVADLPRGLGGDVEFIDLFGEGSPGVLTEQAGAWLYKHNLSALTVQTLHSPDGHDRVEASVRLGPQVQVGARPSPGRLGGEQKLLDLAGDGRIDLVQFAPPQAGFFSQEEDGSWQRFTPFVRQPNVDWTDPDLRHTDLTGDGFADLLITRDDHFEWHRSLARQGYEPTRRVAHPPDQEDGPRRVFADGTQTVFLADMNGDGLPDLVHVGNGEVGYWPSLGHGRFGARVAMDAAPTFDHAEQFDPKRLRLADIDGSGVADLIYLGRDAVQVYLNEAGNGWAPEVRVTTFPRTGNLADVQVADLFGNGTACLVWSSPLPGDTGRPLRYLDLVGGQKPHLLTHARNNLGAETSIRYAPSTKFYLQDLRDGRPWATKLPFPVQVVERVEVLDRVSRNWFVTRYRYRHGYFDGAEREFRGFGLVEQFDTETYDISAQDANAVAAGDNIAAASHVPPLHTRTWYHTGAHADRDHISTLYAADYYREPGQPDSDAIAQWLPDTVLPPGLTAAEEVEACRALKGSILRQEVYADDGSVEAPHPYHVSERNYTVEAVQARGANPHAVFFVHPRETLDHHYERRPQDPRIAHSLLLEADDFGNTLKAVSIGYGRRPGQSPLPDADRQWQERPIIAYTESRYARPDLGDAALWADANRAPQPAEVRTWELTGLSPAPGAPRFAFETFAADDFATLRQLQEIPYEAVPAPQQRQKRLAEVVRTSYRRDDLTALLPTGVLQPLALEGETYQLALTPGLLAGYSEKATPAQLAPVLRDEGGYLDLDDDGRWWIPSGRVHYHPDPGATPAQERTEAAGHFFQPRRLRDPYGNDTRIDYDDNDLFVVRTVDGVGNTYQTQTNYRVLQPWRTIDPNGVRSELAFDTLGMIVASATSGHDGEGDRIDGLATDLGPAIWDAFFAAPRPADRGLLGASSTRIVYDVHRFARSGEPNYTAVLAREVHASEPGGQTSPIQVTFTYSDGLGREVQSKRPAEPGPIAEGGPSVAPRWVGTGWSVFNNKGKPVRRYEPFFSATHDFEFGQRIGVAVTACYDALGRVIACLHPNHSYEKVVFDAWQQASWDVNDTISLRPATDPDVSGWFSRLDPADYTPSWQERMLASTDPHERAAVTRTAGHAATPAIAHFDPLGRAVLSIVDNGADGTLQTRVELDVEGNERSVTDPRGNVVLRRRFSVSGQTTHEVSPDSGTRWLLATATGEPLRTWNSRGFGYRFTYDALRRPVEVFVTDAGGERLVEQTTYGEVKPSPSDTYHRGRVWRVRDEAGVIANQAYDFTGNLVETTRQLLDDYRTPVDWALQPLPPVGDAHRRTCTFNALGRLTSVTAPDGSVTSLRYNEANLLEAVEVRPPGGAGPAPIVRNIDYDAKGQRTRIEYGSSAAPFQTTYRYEPDTFRLARLTTSRPNHPDPGARTLQDLRPTYDPMGHITHIGDEAQSLSFFDNACVHPGNDYAYDPAYRLVAAVGREHAGQDAPTGWTDATRVGHSLPGVCADLRQYVETYRYDASGNLLQLVHHAGGTLAAPGQVLWNRRFQYHTDSNRLRGTSAPGEAVLPDYADDPARSYSERYSHDEHGNLTAMPHLAALDWDAEDRLRQADLQGGGTAYYLYDSEGKRVRKVVKRLGSLVEDHVYLDGYEVQRRTQNGNLVRERSSLHVLDDRHRIALIETLLVENGSPVAAPVPLTRYQLGDALDSAALELDEAAQVISYEEYYPYGSTAYQATDQVREVPAKRFRYLGKERDQEHGLGYHEARYYAPWLGRWISPDPAGLGDGPNVYCYARSSPVARTDSDGRQSRRITTETEIVVLNNAGTIKLAQKSRREDVIDASGKVKRGKESTRNLTPAERAKALKSMDAQRKEMEAKLAAEKREQERQEQQKAAQEKERARTQDKTYKLVVAINVSSTDKKGTVESSENPGHTFVALKDQNDKVVKVISYGPKKAFGLGNIACSAPGTTSYHLLKNDEYLTYEWDITEEQSDKAKQKIEEIEKNPGTYSGTHQCTTVALEVTDAAGLSGIPRGKGDIDIPLCADAKGVSTPYHLNQELQDAKHPHSVQKGSDFAGHGLDIR